MERNSEDYNFSISFNENFEYNSNIALFIKEPKIFEIVKKDEIIYIAIKEKKDIKYHKILKLEIEVIIIL